VRCLPVGALMILACGAAAGPGAQASSTVPAREADEVTEEGGPGDDGPGVDGPSPVAEPSGGTAPQGSAHAMEGIASWYGPGFAGRRTASGERFDPSKMTAAHRTLPFGTRVRVVALRTGDSVVVRINDRGPFGNRGRIIDLARGAARRIGLDRAGVMRVRLEIVGE
jgi:rare lipoprotein A